MSVVVTPAALPSSTVVKVINPLSTSAESTFEDSYHRRLAYPCGPSSISAVRIARHARLISCIRDTGLSIWRILKKQSLSDDEDLVNGTQDIPDSGGWEKVLDVELNVHTNLVASAMSDDGQWLVVSDLYETKLFSIEIDVSLLLK
jgi:U3 small nucleolar RNA-associated protein 4